MSFRYAALLLLLCTAAEASEIKGKVTNAMGGEPLGRVQVTVLEAKVDAVTSAEGGFDIHDLAAGRYTLRINAVGYRLITIPITLASADDTKELSITLVPDNFHHTDRVEVHGDAFQTSDSPATNETTLTSSEIREASTVFADDPFRAVQALPGVSAAGNNEFFAEFSVMGAPFSSVSIYIDDVLVHSPFHEIGNFSEGASLGVLTSEVVEEMKLMPAAYPEKFGDAIGAALDIHTREGSRAEPTVRISGGVAASDLLAEGGFGESKKGSWLISGRKSYINYLVRNRVQNAPDIGFEDADLKLNYDLTPRQNVSLFATDGHTNLAMNNTASLGQFDYASGKSDFTFSRAGWRWTVTPRLLLDARAAYYREPDQLFNNQNILLTKTDHREWVGGTGVSWAWANDQVLQAGWSERFLRDSESQAAATLSGALRLFAFSGAGLRQSGYVQEASSLLGGRVHVLGSLRWDRFQAYLPQRFSPEASVAVHAARGTEFQLSAGRYSQFSNSAFAAPPGLCVADGSLPPRSDHYAAAIEERLSENTRIRVEAFQRKDFYVLGAIRSFGHGSSCPGLEPIPGGTYQRDYSQGVQVVLQRRSANRLSGWLGYTLARARERQYQVVLPPPLQTPLERTLFLNTGYYPTLDDQRSTLNAFATYRLRPSLSLSGKWLYGSGFPIPSGTFVQLSNGQFVETGINTQRLGIYQRLDVRTDKDWAFQRWKLTLYGEVLNLTNHYNARFTYQSGINPTTGQAQVQTLQGLPITPTAGLVFQF